MCSDTNREKFHWLFLSEQNGSPNRYDTIIAETTNFAVVPSLGSLVPGWIMIVPKFPVPRIAALSVEVRQEFEALSKQCIERVSSNFDRVFVFEHGGDEGSKISCGVDQAHLHIVPLPFDLLDVALQSIDGCWIEQDKFVLPYNICGAREYWYVSDLNRTAMISASEPKSQLFRKLIALRTGQAQKWDYKKYPFEDHIEKTLKVMGADG